RDQKTGPDEQYERYTALYRYEQVARSPSPHALAGATALSQRNCELRPCRRERRDQPEHGRCCDGDEQCEGQYARVEAYLLGAWQRTRHECEQRAHASKTEQQSGTTTEKSEC